MYGLLTAKDVETLEAVLTKSVAEYKAGRLNNTIPFRVLEIGVCHGDTARGIKSFLEAQGIEIEYYGVDNHRDKQIEVPFEGAKMLYGDSSEVWTEFYPTVHFLLIDGCHCVNHTMLDFLHFSKNLMLYGYCLFHDVSPKTQNKGDYQGHGPRNNHFGTSVREALTKVGLLNGRLEGWFKWKEAYDESDWGGIAAFEKIAV